MLKVSSVCDRCGHSSAQLTYDRTHINDIDIHNGWSTHTRSIPGHNVSLDICPACSTLSPRVLDPACEALFDHVFWLQRLHKDPAVMVTLLERSDGAMKSFRLLGALCLEKHRDLGSGDRMAFNQILHYLRGAHLLSPADTIQSMAYSLARQALRLIAERRLKVV